MSVSAPGGGQPIDLEHLEAQTAGDKTLERQVLDLYREQIPADLVNLRAAAAGRAAKEIAHRIVGASRAVGANGVADAARAIETAELADTASVEALAAAFELANAFIADYLHE